VERACKGKTFLGGTCGKPADRDGGGTGEAGVEVVLPEPSLPGFGIERNYNRDGREERGTQGDKGVTIQLCTKLCGTEKLNAE